MTTRMEITREVVKRCKKALESHYGPQLRGLILYGSAARNQADSMDAIRKKDGSLASEGRLARNRCERGNPGKDRLLPESKTGLTRGKCIPDYQPLVHGKAVHHDQCDPEFAVFSHLAGKKPREVMQNHRLRQESRFTRKLTQTPYRSASV